jgi:putative FmdB family regulatory protein
MPIYDFRCRACGHEFEALVPVLGTAACPACSAADVERLVSAFGVRSGRGLSPAARRAVQKQQAGQHRDQAAYQQEIEKKHFDD